MSFVSGLTHLVGNVAAPVLEGAGAINSAVGGGGELSQIGHAISNPNVAYTGSLNPITAINNSGGASSFAPAATNNTQAATTNTPNTSAGTNSNSGSYTYSPAATGGSAIDPNTGLTYDALTGQVNSSLADLGNQQTVGNQNISDAYNTQVNALNTALQQAQNSYNNNTASTLQNYVGARGNEQQAVGQQANSLQRLLGAHGYSGSANTGAAYLAAQQGTAANNALQHQYAGNQQALDQNFGDYKTTEQQQQASLDQQKSQQINALQAQVNSNKSALLQQLAEISTAKGGNSAAYNPQIAALNSQITQLGQQYASPVLQATAPTYQAPSLASYDAPTQAAAQVSNNAAANNVNPYLSVLLNGQNQDKTNLNNISS